MNLLLGWGDVNPDKPDTMAGHHFNLLLGVGTMERWNQYSDGATSTQINQITVAEPHSHAPFVVAIPVR